MPEYSIQRLTRAEVARRWGVSKPMVTKYAERGLPFDVDGKIEAEVADAWRAANIITSRSGNPSVRAGVKPAPKPPKAHVEDCRPRAVAPTEDDSAVTPETLAEAVRQEAWEKVRQRRLANDERELQLVELAAINAWVAGMILRAREELTRIASELRDGLATENDPIACEEMVGRRIGRALSYLAEYRAA